MADPREATHAEILETRVKYCEPNRIVAYAETQTVGDFTVNCLYAATLARRMGDCDLIILYRENRPFKKFITELVPGLKAAIGAPKGVVLPLDWFDKGYAPEILCPDPSWYNNMVHLPSLLLTPSMVYHPTFVDKVIRMRIPPEKTARLASRLRRAGVDPDRWFAGLHIRESGYEYRRGMDTERSVLAGDYLPAVDRILEAGGQVVQIGHKGTNPLPARPGLISLCELDDAFDLQTFAFSRARFTLCADSGPAALSAALKVPVLTTNAFGAGGWNRGDAVLYTRLILKGGGFIPPDRILSEKINLTPTHPLAGEIGERIPNTPAEIEAATIDFLSSVEPIDGWRDHWPEDEIPVGKTLTWPQPIAPPKVRVMPYLD